MEKVLIGQIINTHGIRGDLKVKSSTDFVEERFKKGAHVFLDDHGQMLDMIVAGCRYHKGHLLVVFENHRDINLVEKYKGCSLYAYKDEDLLDEDEYYVDDLIDCDVYDRGVFIGRVIDIQLFDHHDIIVVDGKKKIMIPYVDAFVKDIDLDEERIDVELIEGFYDED